MKQTAMSNNEVLDELRAIRRALAVQSSAVLGIEDAAAYLSISSTTLKRITSAGEIRSVQITEGRVGWTRKALDSYITAREESSR